MRPPVLILGMHRSGTTMLVQLLSELGFFAGEHLDPNAEPWYFLRRNEWILRRAGGAWDQPNAVEGFLAEPVIRRQLVELLRDDLSRRFGEFVSNGLSSARLDQAWGAKDPRLSFTLPVWRELFPDCRVLLVRRNGIDVARSLVHRATRELTQDTALCIRPLLKRIKGVYHPFEFMPHWSMPTRCFDLPQGFALWEEYVKAAESSFVQFDGEKLALRYEDLLEQPTALLAQVAEFCGLDVPAERIATITERIDPSRRLAFLQDPEAREFYQQVRQGHWMRSLGYDGLTDR